MEDDLYLIEKSLNHCYALEQCLISLPNVKTDSELKSLYQASEYQMNEVGFYTVSYEEFDYVQNGKKLAEKISYLSKIYREVIIKILKIIYQIVYKFLKKLADLAEEWLSEYKEITLKLKNYLAALDDFIKQNSIPDLPSSYVSEVLARRMFTKINGEDQSFDELKKNNKHYKIGISIFNDFLIMGKSTLEMSELYINGGSDVVKVSYVADSKIDQLMSSIAGRMKDVRNHESSLNHLPLGMSEILLYPKEKEVVTEAGIVKFKSLQSSVKAYENSLTNKQVPVISVNELRVLLIDEINLSEYAMNELIKNKDLKSYKSQMDKVLGLLNRKIKQYQNKDDITISQKDMVGFLQQKTTDAITMVDQYLRQINGVTTSRLKSIILYTENYMDLLSQYSR